MIRVSGFILGVVLVVLAFLVVINPDDARRPGIRITSEPMETIKEHVNPWLQASEGKHSDLVVDSERAEPLEFPGAESQHHEDTNSHGKQVAMADDSMQQVAEANFDTEPPVPEAETITDNNGTENDRFLFWSPFRSAWAAEGFAGRLVIATSVPVEVVEEEPGMYRVGFSYRDEMERRFRIERIESITGLQLE